MGFSWRKTFKIKQTRKSKCLSAFDVEHAQCLTGYHVFMVSGLDLARAPCRRQLTARKKGSGYENGDDKKWQYLTATRQGVARYSLMKYIQVFETNKQPKDFSIDIIYVYRSLARIS